VWVNRPTSARGKRTVQKKRCIVHWLLKTHTHTHTHTYTHTHTHTYATYLELRLTKSITRAHTCATHTHYTHTHIQSSPFSSATTKLANSITTGQAHSTQQSDATSSSADMCAEHVNTRDSTQHRSPTQLRLTLQRNNKVVSLNNNKVVSFLSATDFFQVRLTFAITVSSVLGCAYERGEVQQRLHKRLRSNTVSPDSPLRATDLLQLGLRIDWTTTCHLCRSGATSRGYGLPGVRPPMSARPLTDSL